MADYALWTLVYLLVGAGFAASLNKAWREHLESVSSEIPEGYYNYFYFSGVTVMAVAWLPALVYIMAVAAFEILFKRNS